MMKVMMISDENIVTENAFNRHHLGIEGSLTADKNDRTLFQISLQTRGPSFNPYIAKYVYLRFSSTIGF